MTYLAQLTDNELLRSILAALDRIESGLAISLPAPVVNVDPPDLGDIVTAVTGLKPGPSAEEIARAIAEILRFPTPEPDESLARVADSLEKVSNQLRGMSSPVVGGGSVNLTPEATAALADLKHGVSDYEARLDYVDRTDGQPVYIGRAANQTDPATPTWTIEFMTYDGDGNVIRKQVLTGAWDNRAALAW